MQLCVIQVSMAVMKLDSMTKDVKHNCTLHVLQAINKMQTQSLLISPVFLIFSLITCKTHHHTSRMLDMLQWYTKPTQTVKVWRRIRYTMYHKMVHGILYHKMVHGIMFLYYMSTNTMWANIMTINRQCKIWDIFSAANPTTTARY